MEDETKGSLEEVLDHLAPARSLIATARYNMDGLNYREIKEIATMAKGKLEIAMNALDYIIRL